jgi:hypothetical protein
MKRVCILGDSHTACIRLAWNESGSDFPGVDLTFFADQAEGLAQLEPQHGSLVPGNDRLRDTIAHASGGLSAVRLTEYDVVWIVGLFYVYPRVDGFFSQAVVREMLAKHLPGSPALNVIGKIRQVCDIPVFATHRPLMECVEPLDFVADLELYRRTIAFTQNQFFHAVRATVLPQPEQTIANRYYTHPHYSVDSTMFTVDGAVGAKHTRRDRKHMNVLYGDLLLQHHLPAILAS